MMRSNLFHSLSNRDVKLRQNIILSGLLKAIGLFCSLFIVPMTLGYLDTEVYGIWLTITSILFWLSFSDAGLGNGMRNYLAAAISEKDYEKGCSYLSTAFCYLSIIGIILFILVCSILPLLNMHTLFNAHNINEQEVKWALFTAITFTLIGFVIKNIGIIFMAIQQYALNDLCIVLSNVISLVLIYILSKTTEGHLLYAVIAFTLTPLVVFLTASIPIFIKYPQLKPKWKKVDFQLGKQIVGKGLGFFLIQITSCLIIFGSANMFITQFVNPEGVTIYNIAYKYFNLVIIGCTIFFAPMWNAYTDAHVKGDDEWIKRAMRRSLCLWGLSVIGSIILLLFSTPFYSIWIGDSITIPFSVSLSIVVYVTFYNLNTCATMLINGLNKILVQIYSSLITTILYIIMATWAGQRFGIVGISFSMAVCYMAMSVIHLYQCRLLITKKASGIWNK